MSDLVIRGNIVLPDGVLHDGFVTVKNGRIESISEGPVSTEGKSDDGFPGGDAGSSPHRSAEAAADVIDARGCWVIPGGIDAHVHAYSSDESEGFGRMTRSAAYGGVTTVIDMPYDVPEPTTSVERLRAKIDSIDGAAAVDVALYGTVAKRGGAAAVAELAEAGVSGIKLSLYETDPKRFPRIPDDELLQVLQEVRRAGRVAAFHAENGEIIDSLIADFRQRGQTAPRDHCHTRPAISETLAIVKALEFAYELGVSVHIAHCTLPRGFELIEQYRAWGADVTAETCLHYLLLTEDDMDRLKAFGKINPPLRSEQAKAGLWEALLSGKIDFVTSDHVAWPLSVKRHDDIFANSSGAPGVSTLVPLLYSEAVAKRGLSMPDFARLVAEGPAKRFGLYPRKGAIIPGADADFTIIDPNGSFTVRPANDPGAAEWSPYEGMTAEGRVVRTIVRGQTVYDGVTVSDRSIGQFVPFVR